MKIFKTNFKPQASKKTAIFGNLQRETFDHKNQSDYIKKFSKGLTRELVEFISQNNPATERYGALCRGNIVFGEECYATGFVTNLQRVIGQHLKY